MKLSCTLILCLVVTTSHLHAQSEFQEFKVDRSVEVPKASPDATEAWKDQRFGMFIHWGPISQMGRQLSHSRHSVSHRTGGKPYKVAGKNGIEPEVYDQQYKTFDPVNFDPDEMMKMARSAGVAYTVFTAKHHAGFSMFDSAHTEYDMMSTPYKKDITRMLAEAARANGIDFGFYYSPRDWHHPDCDSDEHHDRYIDWYKKQMQELLTNYGPISELWFDGMGPGDWGNTSAEIMGLIRKLHPDAKVNDRGGVGADFYTPEHYTSYFNTEHAWEACHTTTSQWGYNPGVSSKKFDQLMEILLYTWGADGNILLNIGPMGDGSVNPAERKRFEQLADWWKVHGETTIRGSRGGPFIPGPWGVSTNKDNSVFLHVFRWGDGPMAFPAVPGLVLQDSRRPDGGKVNVTKRDGVYLVDVAKNDREDIVTTIELQFDKSTRGLTPLQRVPSLVADAKLTATHSQDLLPALSDQNASTQWTGKLDTKNKNDKVFELTARFDDPKTIGSMSVSRGENWSPQHIAKIEISDPEGGWKDVSKEVRGMKGGKMRFKFTPIKFFKEPVTTNAVRMTISGTNSFTMAEWELFPPVQ